MATIISVLSITILFLLLNRFALFDYLYRNRLCRRLSKTGQEASAILLRIEPTGTINNMLQVRMQIQVQPEKGRNFVTETKEIISRADFELIAVGSKIRVRYNPANTNEVIRVACDD